MKRLAAICVLLLAACGSGSGYDHTTTIGNGLNQVGVYDGFQIHRFTVDGHDCIFAEDPQDNNIALSCDWPTATTTTSTTIPF